MNVAGSVSPRRGPARKPTLATYTAFAVVFWADCPVCTTQTRYTSARCGSAICRRNEEHPPTAGHVCRLRSIEGPAAHAAEPSGFTTVGQLQPLVDPQPSQT